jgi:rubrerythrin
VPLEPFQQKLLQLYKDQELQMARLYQKLAQSFPTYADQFLALASEEQEHAGWIDHLQNCISSGTAVFSEGKTRTYTLNALIAYVKGIHDALEAGTLDLPKALSLVVDTEKSFIERHVFERFAGDSPEVERILRILDDTQRDHLTRIDQFARQVRSDLAKAAQRCP